MQEQPKNVVETRLQIHEKISIQGEAPIGVKPRRRVRCRLSLGNGQRPLPKEITNIHVAGLLVAVFCAHMHISMLASQRSLPEHNPKFSERKNFPIAFYPTFFFHHYDWNRWFASLATTVDNTIKMAERSFKHGRQ